MSTGWIAFNRSNVDNLPSSAGVYELGNADRVVVYVGRTDNLKRRLNEHLNNPTDPCIKRVKPSYFRYETCVWERQCCERERQLILQHQSAYRKLPECNDKVPDCTGLR